MPKNQPATAASSAAMTSRTIHSSPRRRGLPSCRVRWAWPRRAGAPSPRPGPACAGHACWAATATSAGAVDTRCRRRRPPRPEWTTVRRPDAAGHGHHGGRVAAGAGDHLGGLLEAAVRPRWAFRWAAAHGTVSWRLARPAGTAGGRRRGGHGRQRAADGRRRLEVEFGVAEVGPDVPELGEQGVPVDGALVRVVGGAPLHEFVDFPGQPGHQGRGGADG